VASLGSSRDSLRDSESGRGRSKPSICNDDSSVSCGFFLCFVRLSCFLSGCGLVVGIFDVTHTQEKDEPTVD